MSARYLSRLRLSAFRNYASAALDLDDRHLVLTGPNGAGKTNLLEAVSLLTPGRGLRRAAFDTLGNQASGQPWAVAATIETPEGPVDIGTGATDDGGRRVRINGANARTIEEMSDYLRVLWLTPAMDGLFTGPASDRRRFLDRLVTTLIPSHSAAVSDYEKAMRQRNRLLEDNADPLWLNALEAEMAAHAAAVHFGRTDAVAHLQRRIDQSRDDTAFPAARLSLTPLFDDRHAPASSLDLESELRSIWAASRGPDRAAGRALAGPHRVDFEVLYAQKQMPASLGSTGEQKALLVGLILAHARLVKAQSGLVPFLLLDEIAAHLDPHRRASLFDALEAMGAQSFMTGTDPSLFDALGDRAQRMVVRDGRLQKWQEDMPSEAYDLFVKAMREKKQVLCLYDGAPREICPIVLGHSGAEEKALVFQFGGTTSHGPVRSAGEWKCLRLAGVSDVQLRNGPWFSGDSHASSQTCVKIVDFDVNPDSPFSPRFKL